MPVFDHLILAVLTKPEDDAGTDSTLNVTVNVGGVDILDKDYAGGVDDAEGTLFDPSLEAPLDVTGVTNNSIRLGIRDDDAWGPQHVLLFGHVEAAFTPGRTAALAMETDLTHWLSTDSSEGRLSMPLRLVSTGDSTTVIRRVLFIVHTIWESFLSHSSTDSPVTLEIRTGANLVMSEQIPDTPQPDLENGVTNWYFFDAPIPFTRGDLLAGGGVRLSILGDDAWRPFRLFLFGLDTAAGRPDNVVTLVSEPNWQHGWMSTDASEGVASGDLTVESV